MDWRVDPLKPDTLRTLARDMFVVIGAVIATGLLLFVVIGDL